jgi:hypothetical protein
MIDTHAANELKIAWRVPEGLEIAWSPVNQAYFALWPAKRKRADQQVLKVADAAEMDDWLRDRYGPQYGRTPSRGHARVLSHEELHAPGALRAATDLQVKDFYRDEQRDVAKVRSEASRRGLSLHARRKQLDRDITEHVPSWRGGKI